MTKMETMGAQTRMIASTALVGIALLSGLMLGMNLVSYRMTAETKTEADGACAVLVVRGHRSLVGCQSVGLGIRIPIYLS